MNNSSTLSRLFLATSSGFLLWVAWPPSPVFFFIFFAFVPLFIIEQSISNDREKHSGWRFFGFSILALFIWNVLTTYWIYFATASAGAGPAASFAWLMNSIFQAIPFWGYHRLKKRYNQRIGFIALISFWLCFEWIHFSWELAWPWLTLGNSFAKIHQLVQWYEFTGVSGGTTWVLVVNCLVYLAFFKRNQRKRVYPWLAAVVLIPMLFSMIRYLTYKEKGEDIEVVVVQPNVDPYASQHSRINVTKLLDEMYDLATQKTTKNTDYIVFPETSLPTYAWVNDLQRNNAIFRLKQLLDSIPDAQIIVGADLFENYGSVKKTATARYTDSQGGFYYDLYNAALEINSTGSTQYYVKSKLVPGVERMPYPNQLRFLEKLVIDLGGASGSRATQKERTVFDDGPAKVAPAICYESIFGDYMNEFVKNGANVFFVITNDGWWKDTPGYKQHLVYAKLRAIENRRAIARSANTGISATINQRGDITHKTKWWEAASFNETIQLNNKRTLYTKYGEVLYRVAILLSIILIFISFVKRWTDNFKYRS